MAEPGFADRPAREVIPDLDSIPPGPYLAAILASIDRTELNGHDLVVVLRAHDRIASHYQAERLSDMVEVAHCAEGSSDSPAVRVEERVEFASDEVRAALALTRRSAETDMGLALELAERLPEILEAFRGGRLSLGKVWVIVKATSHLPVDIAQEIADRALEHASGMTTGQLRAWLRRLGIEADPDHAKKQLVAGVEERRVALDANIDGTAAIIGDQLPPDVAVKAHRRIQAMALDLKSSGDPRTMDQLRADVFLDLLNGESTGVAGGTTDIRIDLTTLAELDESPGDIPGWGPVIADISRQLAEENATWQVTVIHPETGLPVWAGTTKRRPTVVQRRYVEARSPTCVHPGCRMPARDCDIDHTHAWAEGGETNIINLAPNCRHDHILQDHGWKLKRIAPGVYQWTSPLGHVYITRSEVLHDARGGRIGRFSFAWA